MALIDTAKIGKKGGEARAKNLSAKERSESASKAAKARWAAEKKAAPKKTAGGKK
jgi:hypothetical protein